MAACLFVFAALYFRKGRPLLSSLLTLGIFALAGAFAIQTRAGPSSGTLLWSRTDEPVLITAHVISEGNLETESPQTVHQRIDIETESIESGNITRAVRAGVRLNIYSKPPLNVSEEFLLDEAQSHSSDPMPLFRYGQRIRFPTQLNLPRNFRNPGAFDFVVYLHDEGIIATASVKYADLETLAGFSGSRIGLFVARARRSIIERIHILWPEQVAVLLDAMLVGEKSFIERPTRVDFQRSGTYHMLIVAGLHVGILVMFTVWLLRRLGLGDLAAGLITLLLIFFYAALTKEGSPVWRATLMLSVYLLTRFLYRKRAVLNAVGAAALVLLVANPNSLFGASLQMSFLCVALIAGVAVPFLEHTVEPYAQGLRNLDALAWDRSLPPKVAQFRLDLRLILSRVSTLRLPRWLAIKTLSVVFRCIELVVISLVMQLGMALPMAYYFHRATSVAIVANLLAVPLLQLLMPAAVLAIGASYVSLWLARFPAVLAGVALQAIAGTVRWLGGLSISDVRLPVPGTAVIVFSAIAIFLAISAFRRNARLSVAGMFLLAISALCVWKHKPA